MKNRLGLLLLAGLCLCAGHSAMAYPKPSISPIAWELRFEHANPKRIVVEVPGQSTAKAYWYMTYTVTNTADHEVTFLPTFDWVTKEGAVVRSDHSIPAVVFEKIKAATGNKLLESALKIAGTVRQGEDQARDGVAIWPEPGPRLGAFSIFVTGLSGESTPLNDEAGKGMSDAAGKPILLYKTFEMDYKLSGDEVYPGNDLLQKQGESWVMR